MVHTPGKKSRIPVKIIMPLTLFIMVGCVLVAGCSIPMIKNTKVENSSSPTITPSISGTTPADMQTIVPGGTETSQGIMKGQLKVSIWDYPTELPVFIDNVSVGNVLPGKPLNLTVDVGRHSVMTCVIGSCIDEDVLIISSNPTTIDFGERLKNKIVSGSLRVSVGGYTDLPVFVDDKSVGNASLGKPLNLMVSEGNHNVKVCVGLLCVNDDVEIKFAKPVYIDFGDRLKKVAEFSTPTIRIVETRQTGDGVTVDVEFINPEKNDLTMSATIQCTYSYINPTSHYRQANFKQGTVTQSVKAGTRAVKSPDLYLTGGSAYNIEIPVILEMSVK